MHRLTTRHLSTFTALVKAYMKLYGLAGWHIEVHREASADAMAWVTLTYEARRADFFLNERWDEEPTRDKLIAKARHEVIHVLLARISKAAADRHATALELNEAEEELVIRLMEIMPKRS